MTIRRLLNYWFGKKRSGFYVFLGFVSATVYFTGLMLQSSESPALSALLKQAGFLSFPGIILAFFIHLNLHAGHWFLEHFKDTDHLPKKQIMLVNSFCMTLFLGSALVSLPALALCLDPLWQAIGRWFSNRTALDKAVYPPIYMESQPMDTPDLSALLGEPKPTALWISFLDKIMRAAGAVIILFLIALAIRSLLLRIWAWITKPRFFDDDEKIYLKPAWSLPLSPQISPEKGGKGFRLSYDEKIRQKYRRKILSLSRKKKHPPAPSASPTELEQAVELCHPTLHRLYEKARYSENGCTKTDWEMLSK